MSAAGKGGKHAATSAAQKQPAVRHRKLAPVKTVEELAEEAISCGATRRMSYCGGLKRSKNPSLTKASQAMGIEWLREFMRLSTVHAIACGRITVDTMDAVKVLRCMKMPVLGAGYSGAARIMSYNGANLLRARSRRNKPAAAAPAPEVTTL